MTVRQRKFVPTNSSEQEFTMACPCFGEAEKEFEAAGLPDGIPGQASMDDRDMGGQSLVPSLYLSPELP
jgi:hypothetical protein